MTTIKATLVDARQAERKDGTVVDLPPCIMFAGTLSNGRTVHSLTNISPATAEALVEACGEEAIAGLGEVGEMLLALHAMRNAQTPTAPRAAARSGSLNPAEFRAKYLTAKPTLVKAAQATKTGTLRRGA